MLPIFQSSSITGTSPYDCLVSYKGHSLRGCLTFLQSCSLRILQPHPNRQVWEKQWTWHCLHWPDQDFWYAQQVAFCGFWKGLGILDKMLDVIISFYERMRAVLPLDGDFSNSFDISNGIKRVCVMTPFLFASLFRHTKVCIQWLRCWSLIPVQHRW